MMKTENKPCRYSDCVHYKKGLSEAEYRKIKHCRACGYAFVNRIPVKDRIIYAITRVPRDRFVSLDDYEKLFRRNIIIGIIISGLVGFIAYWTYINVW